MNAPILYIVVPCYNEGGVLVETGKRLRKLMSQMAHEKKIDPKSRVCLVDDGSKDDTWRVIRKLTDENPLFEGLKLAHNAGHQNALWAGMMTVRLKADAVVSIDADLQDDVGAIRSFVDAYLEGHDIVYGVRSKRDTDTAFKRNTARFFYRFMRSMGVETVDNHADYRLLSRRALDALSTFPEVNLFLRGMVPLLGFETKIVHYERGERFAGESKYPLKKMISFAMEGITSFSVKPIRYITVLGVLFALLGVAMAIYAIVSHARGTAVAGWTSTMMSIWLIGGVQLIALGLIGEYVGKIYSEVKRRPRFIVEEYATNDGEVIP